MKTLRLLMLMAACCAAGTMSNVAFGAETAPAKPGATAAAKPATPVTDQGAGESAAPKGDEPSSAAQPSAPQEDTQAQIDAEAREQAKEQAKTAKPKGKGGSPDRFTPTEQVRADFDVSFPIDI